MPVVSSQKLFNEHQLAVWNITEQLSELLATYTLNEKEKEFFNKLKLDRRKKEWLACRVLLKSLGAEGELNYASNKKPSLEKGFVSFSHSHNWCSTVYSTSTPVGVDIEVFSDKAQRVRKKFVHESELWEGTVKAVLYEEIYYTLLWSIKEAVFKRYSQIEHLEFKRGIVVSTKQIDSERGEVECLVHGEQISTQLKVGYELSTSYSLAYTID
jgi:4'-phosphopantetheinyl transferase EntD